RRNDASMTGQVMIYGGKFYFKWMFHKLHLQMSDYVQHLGCSSVNALSGLQNCANSKYCIVCFRPDKRSA
ncbi:hypothetical protein J4U54_15900, partial [Escherichia coli]